MDKAGKYSLEDLVNPLAVDLHDLIRTPAKGKRKLRHKRQTSSCGSSAKKPPRKETRMAPGLVSALVTLFQQPQTDTNNVRMHHVEHQHTPERDNAGNRQALAGNQGEKIIREFSKMNLVKREICDNKDKKDFCRSQITCHYDALSGNFMAKRVTNEGIVPKLKPTEVFGIVSLHQTYQEAFMKAVSVDLGSYCNSQTDTWSLDNAWLNDDL